MKYFIHYEVVEDVPRSKNPFWVQPEAKWVKAANYSDLWVYWMAGTSQENCTEQQLGAYEMKRYERSYMASIWKQLIVYIIYIPDFQLATNFLTRYTTTNILCHLLYSFECFFIFSDLPKILVYFGWGCDGINGLLSGAPWMIVKKRSINHGKFWRIFAP